MKSKKKPGSRIGVLFMQTPQDSNKAEMHFIINGEDQGPCTRDIPYKEGALHAVIDVYGTTKQVKIIQLYGSKFIFSITTMAIIIFKYFVYFFFLVISLQSACRDAILTRVEKSSVSKLPLPTSLKDYLLNFY